ncbi:MAG: sigma-70 family RNA polymerase sigma factor [Clostridiaceae bacterium]
MHKEFKLIENYLNSILKNYKSTIDAYILYEDIEDLFETGTNVKSLKELFDYIEKKYRIQILNKDILFEELENYSPSINFDNIKEYSKLTNEELIRLYKLNTDLKAREELILKNKNLVYKAATHRKGMSLLEYEDLVQEGIIGLIIGIEKFNIEYPSKFSTYIYYWIKQRIDRAIHNTGSTIRLPVHLINKINRLIYIENVTKQKNIEIEKDEICDYLSITDEQYENLKILISQFKNVSSLNAMLSEDSNDSDSELLDFMSNETNILSGTVDSDLNVEDTIMKNALKESIEDALGILKAREKQILEMRFGLYNGEEMTLEKIGDHFNLTRERIRQIEASALNKLRKNGISKNLEAYYYK